MSISTVPAALFVTRGFTLADWQRAAVASWATGDNTGAHRGTFEVFTGGGKTLLALSCAAMVAAGASNFRLVIVVPTIALASQWEAAVVKYTTIDASLVRRITGPKALEPLADARVAILVINTAAKYYAALSFGHDAMLVVDECHRAGAPLFRDVLKIAAEFRLGLSATPEREELDESGEALHYDQQVVAKGLGSVVYRFDLADARRAGWLPEYAIVHHGIDLDPDERAEYDKRSRRVDEAADRLRTFGSDPSRARLLQGRSGDAGDAARTYLAAVSARKDVVYRARERTRIACRLAIEALAEPSARVLLFNERIDAVEALTAALQAAVGTAIVDVEHSKRSNAERRAALDGFRDGSIRALVSAKSLIEGIDVPEASVGISVASTGSVRQRIQALGRVLRLDRTSGQTAKLATMHVIYVANTVDESIYEKEDWVDLTGASRNVFLRWSLDPDADPIAADGPPRRPKSTESQEFERLARDGFTYPQPWFGVTRAQDYRIDTRGNVVNAFDTTIENAQGVGEMIRSVRGSLGGRFVVTPTHRFVLVANRIDDVTKWFVAGALAEEFRARKEAAASLDFDVTRLAPGDPYPGPLTAHHGKWKLRAREGGIVERSTGGRGREVAQTGENSNDANEARENLARLLQAWKGTKTSGMEIAINELWDAWYRDGGTPKFLARIAGGLSWKATPLPPAASNARHG